MNSTGVSTVVVIEDDPDIRELIRSVLSRGGIVVHTAENGLDGVALVTSIHPDLVTLDIGLPDIDGYEVARRLRLAPGTADIQILMLSARTHELDPVRGRDAGAELHLSKPFRPRELRAQVDELLARL
ncbi:response regulator transcription factor [Sanguibacter antarcticus]|uniref:Response regulator receiver domain-containing protein n=1 Tax=Sanguibacter antarcticus TaxID=372484 RepID=A0A2A9E2N5_9MICO|nr:response regulator [Sanguibacter antarcticus]PFG32450.1 response regulator receiver domain-containing protein [Sanguibacter antarcticus]